MKPNGYNYVIIPITGRLRQKVVNGTQIKKYYEPKDFKLMIENEDYIKRKFSLKTMNNKNSLTSTDVRKGRKDNKLSLSLHIVNPFLNEPIESSDNERNVHEGRDV